MGGTQRRGPVEQRRDRLPGQSLVDETVGFGGHAKTLQRLQRQTHQLAREACSVMDERLRFVARLLDGEAMTEVCREFGAVVEMSKSSWLIAGMLPTGDEVQADLSRTFLTEAPFMESSAGRDRQ
jgi:hypothetical protein